MALGTSGCLITDKAEFSPPAPTPPFVTNLEPSPTEILYIPRKPGTAPDSRDYVETQNVSFEIRSDDMQRYLFSFILVDYPTDNPNRAPPMAKQFPADIGTLDTARIRATPLIIPATVPPGCHSITAIVSHDSSIYQGVVKPPLPGEVADVGIGTWWAQIGTDTSDPGGFPPCEPNPPKAPDAGADARIDGVGR
jgi:hypothetical protein